MKKRLTQDQEFQIMKLVLDKFLWIGLGIMLFGFYDLSQRTITSGISWILSGVVVLVLFVLLIIKHYEISP
ncbi:MAG TPA: hypothetical protein VKE88_04025 [Candidatus Nanoarchaeia archaeon]|nr:hypothetical protein [Candidatus Nanoarchaeia archaeon]